VEHTHGTKQSNTRRASCSTFRIILKPLLDATDYGRLTGQLDDSLVDVSWCDKLPTPTFSGIAHEFTAIVDQHVGDVDDLRYLFGKGVPASEITGVLAKL
jgi:hypothetical protein